MGSHHTDGLSLAITRRPPQQIAPTIRQATVIGEWQDSSGQWWETVVVKDTATVFKSTASKIEKPSGRFENDSFGADDDTLLRQGVVEPRRYFSQCRLGSVVLIPDILVLDFTPLVIADFKMGIVNGDFLTAEPHPASFEFAIFAHH